MKNLLLYCLLCFSLVSCSSQPVTRTVRGIGTGITFDEMNREIRLSRALGMEEIFDKTGVVRLDLINASEDVVTFPSDYNIQILIIKGTRMDPVPNVFGYPDGDISVLPAHEDPLGISIGLAPELRPDEIPARLRIVVQGEIQKTGKVVGAFIDIDLAAIK